MADNLQDFLRKAAERRAAQQQGQAPTPPAPQRQTPPPRLQPVPEMEIYDSEQVYENSVTPDDVIQHVEDHIDTSDIQRRVAKLGQEVAEHSQDERLHEVFDHSVGRLSKKSVTDEAYERKDADKDYMVDEVDYFEQPAKSTKSNILEDLMKSPQSIRQAFIFSEIIGRPTDRWEG